MLVTWENAVTASYLSQSRYLAGKIKKLSKVDEDGLPEQIGSNYGHELDSE